MFLKPTLISMFIVANKIYWNRNLSLKSIQQGRVCHIKYTEFSNFIYLEQLLSTMCTCSQLLWIIFKKLYVSFNPTNVLQTGLTRKKWFLNGLEMQNAFQFSALIRRFYYFIYLFSFFFRLFSNKIIWWHSKFTTETFLKKFGWLW